MHHLIDAITGHWDRQWHPSRVQAGCDVNQSHSRSYSMV